MHVPLESVLAAKRAVAAGKASFDDHLVLLLHFSGSQQWGRVLEHLKQAEALAAGKPGLRWVRSAILLESRRREELRKRYLEDAARLVKAPSPSPDAYPLAEYIVGQASGVLEANEMLGLLDSLKPIYDKQPAHVQAGKQWQIQRITYLDRTGRADEAQSLRKQLAVDFPHDANLQRQFALALADAGDFTAAYAWLTRVLVKEAKWLEAEESQLRDAYSQLLQRQGRYGDLARYLAGWVAQNPESYTAYAQYLSALIKSDQIEKADTLMLQWLKEARMPGDLPAPAQARMQAAVYQMMGNGHQLYTNYIERRWLAPLAEFVLFAVHNESHGPMAEYIMRQHTFQRSDGSLKLRKTLAGILAAEVDKLSAEQIRRLVDWVQYEDTPWTKITASLRQRWTDEKKEEAKHLFGQALVTILSRQEDPAELLAFLRLQLQTGPVKYRAEYAGGLFERLLSQPWTAAIESEALSLLDRLSTADEPGDRLFVSVGAVHRLTDRMLENRIAAQTKMLEHPEKLTRTDLLKKQAEIRKLARAGLADSLRKESAKASKEFGPWLLAESMYLDVLADRNLEQVAAEAWQYLGAAPPKTSTDEPSVISALEQVLRERYLLTATNLAARKGAQPKLIDRLMTYFDKGIEAESADGAARWKLAKSRLLVALDRTKDLEQTLKQWTRADDADSRWRIELGYLMAEQGRVPEAIEQFEAVKRADELSPSAYRSLAEWYLVQGQRDKHERAAAAVYETMPEQQISRLIEASLSPWQRGARRPTELDKDVLHMFSVLFDKSAAPQNYLHQLQRFYQACRDFRLLAGLPDAVIGHSAEQVYPFLQGMQNVLGELRDEASADEIVKRIAEVRPRARNDVDQRALDLLEVLVERRAAELKNQPGPHTDRALAALQRAFKRSWAAGEPRLLADFLAGLGKIAPAALADEQIRQLKALHDLATRSSLDRLYIAHLYAQTVHLHKGSADAADILQAALEDFQAAHAGVLPAAADEALSTLISYLEGAGHFVRGEKILLAQLKHPQRRWLIERIDQLYHRALRDQGEVSLGKGQDLYRALHARIRKDLEDRDENQRYQLINLLCQVQRTADKLKLTGAAQDMKTFAFDFLPPVLKEITNHHESVVRLVANTLHDLAGPRDGIAYLLDEIEKEPRWLRYNNQDGWSRFSQLLGLWRTEAKDLGAVEGRLLKLVLAELRRDLDLRRWNQRTMFYPGTQNYFWAEKKADFARAAEEVLALHKDSGAAVEYIAEYLFWGLGSHQRAIEIMLLAHDQKLLDENAQATLVTFLHNQSRYGESIALLEPLVERRPESLVFRVQLMHAYFHTERKVKLLALLKETDAFFHQKDRWGENVLSKLAFSTLENHLFKEAAAYFEELIPLHERTQPNRGIGNGTLAGYYDGLSSAYAGLKDTPRAVDAAAGAIVAWGNRSEDRARALKTLTKVLFNAADVDAFVAQFDKQPPQEDSAVIRKGLGMAFGEKKQFAKAIAQLQLATALQPSDAETHELLVKAYDALGDKAGAIQQLLRAVQVSRRNLLLYQDLGRRLAAAGQTQEAERAYTSIVEMQPMEAESHALLAEIRQQQKRWADAISLWQQVVRLNALEPTGLLKLAAAQIHEKKWDEAEESLRKLKSQTWPDRFGNVRQQIQKLERKLALQRKR